ncbi:MAG: hypothetical protein GY698_24690 [Actinomycetia bacterium]|nr:hypothetical protein [Actinomycetes bacterium]
MGRQSSVTRWPVIGAVLLLAVGCASSAPEAVVITRRADDVQVVSPAVARDLLADGVSRTGAATRVEAEKTGTTLPVTQAEEGFQSRLSTALGVFNRCLQEEGVEFVGLPGQTDDPAAQDPGYLPALQLCNGRAGLLALLQEQQERQAGLTTEQVESLNEQLRSAWDCVRDRGWAFGELAPNQNGVLQPVDNPDNLLSRIDELGVDLEACGFNDIEFG